MIINCSKCITLAWKIRSFVCDISFFSFLSAPVLFVPLFLQAAKFSVIVMTKIIISIEAKRAY